MGNNDRIPGTTEKYNHCPHVDLIHGHDEEHNRESLNAFEAMITSTSFDTGTLGGVVYRQRRVCPTKKSVTNHGHQPSCRLILDLIRRRRHNCSVPRWHTLMSIFSIMRVGPKTFSMTTLWTPMPGFAILCDRMRRTLVWWGFPP